MLDETSGEISGFSIDLMSAIAAQMNPPRHVDFTVHHDFAEHLAAVQKGEVDLGIAATSMTSERERVVDFSLPFYRGGLGIATKAEGSGWNFLDIVTSKDLRLMLLWLAVFLCGCAHLIWLTEKGPNDIFDDRWHVGIGQAMWWTIVTMTTVGYGDFVPRKTLSRLLGILIIVTGIVFFGFTVGTFSSALTLQRLRSDVRVPDDLRNKPVAVVRNTIGEETLRRREISVVPMASLGEALAAVRTGEVVAAVHDIALLRYHVPRNAPGLTLVGPTFAEHDYGITFPIDSEIRKGVNVALLEIMEGDPPRYQWMLDHWFENP